MMDSFEFNKIAMAVLGTLFFILSVSFMSDALFHSSVPQNAGYVIEAEDDHGGGGEAVASGPKYEPIADLLATADLAAGERVAKKCAACHTFDKGGKNKVGPALFGIVNKPMANADGFSYSAALRDYGAGKQWTYDELNGFLWKPKSYIKGTSMGFAGVKKVADRANLVGYLRSLADTPAPLPGE